MLRIANLTDHFNGHTLMPLKDESFAEEDSFFKNPAELKVFLKDNPGYLKDPLTLASLITNLILGPSYQLIEKPKEFARMYEELRCEDNVIISPLIPSSAFEEYDISLITVPEIKKGRFVFFVTKNFTPYQVSYTLNTEKIKVSML